MRKSSLCEPEERNHEQKLWSQSAHCSQGVRVVSTGRKQGERDQHGEKTYLC